MGRAQTPADELGRQRDLYGVRPSRRTLLGIEPPAGLRGLRCRVHRNHGFELVESVLAPYLAHAGLGAEFRVGAYDDSLTFDLEGAADLEVVWLDLARYAEDLDLSAWLDGRLADLAARTDAPILVVALDDDERLRVTPRPGLFVSGLDDVAREVGERFLDPARAALTGTRLSGDACVAVARRLGAQWIPGILLPPVKALVLDLDQTLYGGVLGEDGSAGVALTAGHLALQRHVRSLREAGVLLCLASRNDEVDVRALFEAREDFPLRWDDFDHRGIGWQAKADTVRAAAAAFRVGVDALLVVDDNPGELLSIAAEVPDVRLLHAGPDGEDTLRALRRFPGLHRWRGVAEDALRAADLRTQSERAAVRAASTGDDYLRSLGVELTFAFDGDVGVARAAELAAKTNQFNLALARTGERELAGYAAAPDRGLATVALRDRLSDSGVVGLVAARLDGTTLVLEEVCISCRALGRGVEESIVLHACAHIARLLGADALEFVVDVGPRNEPALHWLRDLDDTSWDGGPGRARRTTVDPPATPHVALHGIPRPTTSP
ncbi:MAG: HAD-IIIC family phosphatase [Planctomycetota bacterium]